MEEVARRQVSGAVGSWLAGFALLALVAPVATATVGPQISEPSAPLPGAVTLRSMGYLRDMVSPALSDEALNASSLRAHRVVGKLFGLSTALLFVNGLGQRVARPLRDISAEFPELAAAHRDGAVVLDEQLVRDLFVADPLPSVRDGFFTNCSRPGELADVAIQAVLAHELAHLLQETHSAALDGESRELHADILAGWALANGALSGRNVGFSLCSSDVRESAAASLVQTVFRGLGDDRLSVPPESRSHGSGIERGAAVQIGLALPGRTLEAAYAAALHVVGAESVDPRIEARDMTVLTLGFDRAVRFDSLVAEWPGQLWSRITVDAPRIALEGCQGSFRQHRRMDMTVDGVEYLNQGPQEPFLDVTFPLDTLDLNSLSVERIGSTRDLSLIGMSDDWWLVRLARTGRAKDGLLGTNDPLMVLPTRRTADETTGLLRDAVTYCQELAWYRAVPLGGFRLSLSTDSIVLSAEGPAQIDRSPRALELSGVDLQRLDGALIELTSALAGRPRSLGAWAAVAEAPERADFPFRNPDTRSGPRFVYWYERSVVPAQERSELPFDQFRIWHDTTGFEVTLLDSARGFRLPLAPEPGLLGLDWSRVSNSLREAIRALYRLEEVRVDSVEKRQDSDGFGYWRYHIAYYISR